MTVVGRVDSLWRYPVKSMRGEPLAEAFAGFAGVYGDRVYAFRSDAAPKGFPYLTGREQPLLLRCRPSYRHAAPMRLPSNLAEAEALGIGVTPLYAEQADLSVDVELPSGESLTIDDPRLIDLLRPAGRDGAAVTLLRSERALTDCRPISLISVQTVRQLGEDLGHGLDPRRFRANLDIDLDANVAFGEDGWVGRRLGIGDRTQLLILARDSRCKMITIDPETAEANPGVMRCLARDHEGTAGVYAAVLVEGAMRAGDALTLLD
ncbi:MAG: MOSC domain-containing protein [Luteitalea sp.]